MQREISSDMINIDRRSGIPLHRQLYQSLKTEIVERSIAGGTAIPSSRILAAELGLARNTITAAYDQLAAEGYITSRLGTRSTVVDLPRRPTAPPARPLGASAHDVSHRGLLMAQQTMNFGAAGRMIFHPGVPDIERFPFGIWSRLLSRRAASSSDHLFGNHDAAGYPELRQAIAAFLNATRGMRCTPDQIVVTTGAQAALDILARMLLDAGDAIWMEEPGYYGAQAAFAAAGARLVPLHVDAGGWLLDPPADMGIRAIYVTPSCQNPLNTAMRMDQRLRLLDIAARRNAWIIEDDFDGEYRLRGQPVPTLQDADQAGRVIYVGTLAKLLFPALRVGFMVLPPSLVAQVARSISVTGQFAPLVLQAAVADLINQGHMARHLRRMRRIYAQRRQRFTSQWDVKISRWGTLSESGSGIQLVGHLRAGIDDVLVSDLCRRQGVSVVPLSSFYRHESGRSGLVVGYAAADEATMRYGLNTLEASLEAVSREQSVP